MKLVVGLGNPGEKYRETRHNVGFKVVELVAARHTPGFGFSDLNREAMNVRWRRRPEADDVLLVKPLTFMNLSGVAIGNVARYYDIALPDVLIVCDDVNLPLGRLRARASGSDGGHNGLLSIAQHLGTTEYARLRLGVGRGDLRRDLADHVLARFESEETPVVEDAIARAADAVDTWIADGLARMMNTFNRAEDN